MTRRVEPPITRKPCPPGTWLCIALLAAAVGWGAWLRLDAIREESAWCDEVLTLNHLPAPSLPAFLHGAFEEDPRLALSPLYYVLEYAWSAVAGPSLVSMRLLSVALGLLCIVLLYAVACRLFERRTGLLSAFLLAMSLVHVYYAQEVRFYALLCACALLSMWGMAGILDGKGRAWWVLHLLGNALLVWTHAFSLLFLATQGAFLLVFRWRERGLLIRWTAGHTAIGAAFAAWMLLLGYDFQTHSQAYADVPPTLRTLANAMLVFTGGRFSNLDPSPYMPLGISLDRFIAAVTIALATAAVLRPFFRKDATARKVSGLLLLWWLGPMLALFSVSLLWRPCFFERYVLYSSFPLCILSAAAIVQLPRRWLRCMTAAALLLALAYQGLALPRPFRADYQSAACIIASDPGPDRVVHALKLFNALGVRYSKPVPQDRIVQFEGFDELCAATEAAAQAGKTVWAVFYRWERTGEFEARMRAARLRCEAHAFGGMPGLKAYRVSQ